MSLFWEKKKLLFMFLEFALIKVGVSLGTEELLSIKLFGFKLLSVDQELSGRVVPTDTDLSPEVLAGALSIGVVAVIYLFLRDRESSTSAPVISSDITPLFKLKKEREKAKAVSALVVKALTVRGRWPPHTLPHQRQP